MKMFKKISAIVLVVAMMLTMVSVTAFAAEITAEDAEITLKVKNLDGTDVTSVTPGTKVNVGVYLTPGTYSVSVGIKIGYNSGTVNTSEVITNAHDKGQVIGEDAYNVAWFLTFEVTADTPVVTIPVTIPTDAPDGEYTLATILDFAIDGYTLEFPSPATVQVSSIEKNEIATDESGKKTWELEWSNPSQEAVAIIAYYNGTTMLHAELIAIDEHIDETTGTCSFTSEELNYDGATKVRCYLFDKLNGLHPITNAVEEREL